MVRGGGVSRVSGVKSLILLKVRRGIRMTHSTEGAVCQAEQSLVTRLIGG